MFRWNLTLHLELTHLLRLSVKLWFPPCCLDYDVRIESVVDRVDVVNLSERNVDKHLHLSSTHHVDTSFIVYRPSLCTL